MLVAALVIALVAALVIALGAASPASAAAWGRPFRLAGPASLDVIPAQIAFSPTGLAAVAYGVQDEDNPASSSAFTTGRSPRGTVSRSRQIRGAQQILALAYDGRSLELVTGTSPKGYPCCSSVSALRSSRRGGFGSPREIVSGLAGATVARLVAIPAGLLVAVATERGVWVAQSSGAQGFAQTRRLTASSALPESLDATSLGHGQSVVVWTARPDRLAAGPTKIFASRGSQKDAPRGARAEITVPTGHRIDELAVAPGPSLATVAWIESWFDTAGAYHSQAVVSDLRRDGRPKPLSAPDALVSGLSFAGNVRGDQAVAWKECTVAGDCVVRAVRRPARGRFSAAAQLPAVDSSQTPALAVSSSGETVLGWIEAGHVLAVQASRRAARFGAVQVVSGTNFGADLTLAFGAGRQALAVWTQGTLNQSLIGSVLSSG